MKSTTEITIRNYHVDYFGHVNHARFLELLEEARWCYLEENGLIEPIHQFKAFHVVAGVVIDYRYQALMGDILRIETVIDSRSSRSFRVNQKAFIQASGRLAVEATITNVFVDDKGRSQKISDDLLAHWPDLANAVQEGIAR